MKELQHTKVDFAEILKNIMSEYDLTYYRIGKDTSTGVSKWKSYLNGISKPNYVALQELLVAYPDLNPDYLLKGIEPIRLDGVISGALFADVEYIDLPLLSSKARAGLVQGYLSNVNEPDETYQVPKNLTSSSGNVVIEIDGNGMAPTLLHSSKIVCEKVGSDDWGYVTGVVAILYRDYFVVKRIKQNDLLTSQLITLHSDNQDGGRVVVRKEDIKEIWKAKAVCYMPLD